MKHSLNPNSIAHRTVLLMALCCTLIGQSANAFLLQSMDEQRVELLDYVADDQWTLIMFWSTDCIPCEEQKPALEAFHRENKSGLATVVGIAIDGMEHKKEIEKLNKLHKPSYPNLVVYSDVFARQYQEMVGKEFRTTPTFLVFDANGDFQGNIYGYLDFNALQQHMSASG